MKRSCGGFDAHPEVDKVDDERDEGDDGGDERNEGREEEPNAVRREGGDEREERDAGGDGVQDECAREVVCGRRGAAAHRHAIELLGDTPNLVPDAAARALITARKGKGELLTKIDEEFGRKKAYPPFCSTQYPQFPKEIVWLPPGMFTLRNARVFHTGADRETTRSSTVAAKMRNVPIWNPEAIFGICRGGGRLRRVSTRRREG